MSADGDTVREALAHHDLDRAARARLYVRDEEWEALYTAALAALARLEAAEAQDEEWEALYTAALAALARLEAAEAQRDALAKALRLWPQDGSVHEPHCDVNWGRPCDCFTEIARAALAETGLE